MTKQELLKRVEKYVEKNSCDLPHWASTIGVRYDNRVVSVGDELPNSRSNVDRDDTRDFPTYGTPEYDDSEELDGTSVYLAAHHYDDLDDIQNYGLETILCGSDESVWDHAVIVIGMETDSFCEDDGEVVLAYCTVVEILW